MTPQLPEKEFKNPRANHDFLGRTCSISAVGAYVPERIMTNADIEKIVDTTDEWIRTRTGIQERRIAAEDDRVVPASFRPGRRRRLTRLRRAERIGRAFLARLDGRRGG